MLRRGSIKPQELSTTTYVIVLVGAEVHSKMLVDEVCGFMSYGPGLRIEELVN